MPGKKIWTFLEWALHSEKKDCHHSLLPSRAHLLKGAVESWLTQMNEDIIILLHKRASWSIKSSGQSSKDAVALTSKKTVSMVSISATEDAEIEQAFL